MQATRTTRVSALDERFAEGAFSARHGRAAAVAALGVAPHGVGDTQGSRTYTSAWRPRARWRCGKSAGAIRFAGVSALESSLKKLGGFSDSAQQSVRRDDTRFALKIHGSLRSDAV
jgi:hypothetical protein